MSNEKALEIARKAVIDYLKGFNINDPQQIREMAQLKNIVKELENQDTYCEECDNGTDTPCEICLTEEAK
jgi:recombinational DNA repair protein RecR